MFNILKNLNITKVVSTTNTTLKTIKKIIPVYKEVRPYITHEKSFINKDIIKTDNIKKESNKSYNDSLTFFN